MGHGGMSLVKYILHDSMQKCPKCGKGDMVYKPMKMLVPYDAAAFTLPMFYICFNCFHVIQVGVGDVPDMSLSSRDESKIDLIEQPNEKGEAYDKRDASHPD